MARVTRVKSEPAKVVRSPPLEEEPAGLAVEVAARMDLTSAHFPAAVGDRVVAVLGRRESPPSYAGAVGTAVVD